MHYENAVDDHDTNYYCTISDSSRQVGLHLAIVHFIRSASWKAKQGTAGSSSA
jgi:hypothetical protein